MTEQEQILYDSLYDEEKERKAGFFDEIEKQMNEKERGNMSIDIEKIKDEIEYHIQCMDERGQFPNVWINMIYLDENHSHIREYWNQPRFLK